MKKIWLWASILFVSFSVGVGLNSCDALAVGLGEEVDLEAPVITVSGMTSGDASVSSAELSGGVYCKRTVTFVGTATDNKAVERVYAEIKWSDETSFSYLSTANLSGDNWTMPISFPKEGVAVIRVVAEDDRGNASPKSSKSVVLFIDEDAPVGTAWYIDRGMGIQYGLREFEDLFALDLNLTENKDAAQNVSFTIKSNFNDTMGISDKTEDDGDGYIGLKIHIFEYYDFDEKTGTGGKQKKICDIKKTPGSSVYAPSFEVTEAALVTGDSSLSSGKHYMQVYYSAEDVVTIPQSNKAEEVAIAGGWFIWQPESDIPRFSTSEKITYDSNGKNPTITVHIKDVLSVTVFDDDALASASCSGFASAGGVDPSSFTGNGERDTVLILTAPSSPTTVNLTVTANAKTEGYPQDKEKASLTQTIKVNVIDESQPMLLITSPKNNAIPAVKMGSNNATAKVTISGQSLDLSGCDFLEFVWVPDSVATSASEKSQKAKEWLDSITTKTAAGSTAESAGMKLWSVPLGTKTLGDGFYKQIFTFDIDLFNDFGAENKKATDKFFVAKLTRGTSADATAVYAEFRLAADNLPPTISPITPAGDMAIVEEGKDLTLEFKGIKTSGLAMDTDAYEIRRVDDKANDGLFGTYDAVKGYATVAGTYNESTGTYQSTAIAATTLAEWKSKGVKPKFQFFAKDLFGNEGKDQYTIVISDLPQLISISSPSATLCKMGDEILINASFSNTVAGDEPELDSNKPYILLKNISKDGGTPTTKAYYKSGLGTTTLTFSYIVQEGEYSSKLQVDNTNSPVEANGAIALSSEKVVLRSVETSKLFEENKTIVIDGVSPKATSYTITSDADESLNKNGAMTYLREGRTLTVTVATSEKVSIQGTPSFTFDVNTGSGYKTLSLPFERIGSTGTEIRFSKKITADDANGALSYTSNACITGYETITDNAGNSLVLLANATTPNITIDTKAPSAPSITDGNGITLKGGKYKTSVTFKIDSGTDTSLKATEYSLDGGSTWQPYTKAVTLSESAQLTARRTDYAGNESEYTDVINLDINNAFPDFFIECTNPDGNYKAGTTLTFKVTFANKVNVTSSAFQKGSDGITKARIAITGNNSTSEKWGDGKNKGYAVFADTKVQSGVMSLYFTYETQDPDEFTLKVEQNAVTLEGIQDQYGFEQDGKTLTKAYSRPQIKCDGVAPKVQSMTPQGKGTATSASDGIKVYTQGNVVKLTFSEEIQKSSGNLTLRQTYGWAIPPVLSATDFNTICNALTSTQKNILSMQTSAGKDMEDAESLYQANVGTRNMYYHGKGQFVGPYKKSTQGIKYSNGVYVPDVSTKYVLDFDIDIWETDTEHPIGQTFRTTGTSPTLTTVGWNGSGIYHRYTTGESVEPKTPSTTRTAQQIREVLEAAHYHERVIDVTSSYVQIANDNKTVTITFPQGLTDTSTNLPDGREWELVIDKGAFMDMTGNEFGAEYNGVILNSDAVQGNSDKKQYDLDGSNIDTAQTNGGYAVYEAGTWKRGRASITDGSSPVVLITTGDKESYYSDKVATPVVRVDRYSYGLGAIQSNQYGAVTPYIANDGVEPTGYVRVRIDCETKGATIKYTRVTRSNERNTNWWNDTATPYYKNSDNGDCYSYYTSTENLKQSEITTPATAYVGTFAAGNGKYNESCKDYIITAATKTNFTGSETGLEGVYQTVVRFRKPQDKNGNAVATKGRDSYNGTVQTDWSIRGTTGFAGEPSISPFPLRDSQVGSPYLKICYRENNNAAYSDSEDYYWVSYEILVDSSFAGYGYGEGNWNYYDWSKQWGFMRPGEFTRCDYMTLWR